ncbi:MAG: hypothetical protein ACOX8E_05600 [Ruminococcus sp.]|jgi:hypothetical protein
MHILYDEAGNMISHGENHAYDHSHGDHCHENRNENLALLTYMLEHNEHHAEELKKLAEKMQETGLADVSEEIRKGVEQFQQVNSHLASALKLAKAK